MIRRISWAVLAALLVASLPVPAAVASEGTVVAQAEGTRDGGLEPRYQPREPEEPPGYDNSYLFAMTRGVADAPIHPAGQVALYVFTVPLDIALLPFALIGGLF